MMYAHLSVVPGVCARKEVCMKGGTEMKAILHLPCILKYELWLLVQPSYYSNISTTSAGRLVTIGRAVSYYYASYGTIIYSKLMADDRITTAIFEELFLADPISGSFLADEGCTATYSCWETF